MTFETGANEWKTWDARRGKGVTRRKRIFMATRSFLSADVCGTARGASEAPEEKREEFDSYVSDPANPVPYRARPVEETYSGGKPLVYMVTAGPAVRAQQRPDTLLRGRRSR